MRKIIKDLTDIPESLVVDDGNITHQRRKELINSGEYVKEDKFDSRYKTPDIKEKLEGLYHFKCAYCEFKVEQGQVEHYRPKTKYYWLAYSWDNLLYGCPTCNQFKKTDFEITGQEVEPPKITDDLSDINIWSSQRYDGQEKPKLLNPERDELNGRFLFDIQGNVKGNNDSRADYTIETCRLNRDFLIDERRRIIDVFRDEIRAELLFSKDKEDSKAIVASLVRAFERRSTDETSPFTAFRQAAVAWLDEIIKAI